MAFADLAGETSATEIFQTSLRRDRLAHAYLITGSTLPSLEGFAAQVAKTLNCENPPERSETGIGLDSCDQCPTCRQINARQHADLTWIRPESKLRIITIAQIRSLMETIHLKAHDAPFKITIVTSAERMNEAAANAFLKTLEEPPAHSILLLLSSDPQRLLDTILSRCLRVPLATRAPTPQDNPGYTWLQSLCTRVQQSAKGLSTRYHLLSDLLAYLGDLKEQIGGDLTQQSPLEQHEDLEPKLRDRYTQELNAAIEAEYRRQRTETIQTFQWFLRDIWLQTFSRGNTTLLRFPELADSTATIAGRITPERALANLDITDQLQRRLNTNIQEALAVEVALLRIAL